MQGDGGKQILHGVLDEVTELPGAPLGRPLQFSLEMTSMLLLQMPISDKSTIWENEEHAGCSFLSHRLGWCRKQGCIHSLNSIGVNVPKIKAITPSGANSYKAGGKQRFKTGRGKGGGKKGSSSTAPFGGSCLCMGKFALGRICSRCEIRSVCFSFANADFTIFPKSHFKRIWWGWNNIAVCSLQSRVVSAGTRCYSHVGGLDGWHARFVHDIVGGLLAACSCLQAVGARGRQDLRGAPATAFVGWTQCASQLPPATTLLVLLKKCSQAQESGGIGWYSLEGATAGVVSYRPRKLH